MANTHRPRKRRRNDIWSSTCSNGNGNGTVAIDPVFKRDTPAFPLVAFLWPAKGNTVSQWLVLPCVLMLSGLFRWCTAIWPYSGMGVPPHFGDFEAQRHWLEITANLPVTHWYFHDTTWWGLDYPPLTAYHSWILAKVGSLINTDWFALYQSRGLETPDLKLFMRATVYVSEHLLYIPAVIICVRNLAKLHTINSWESTIALTAILMQPATILIDHGHFQYNTVMLGLVVAAMSNMIAGRNLWACIFFVAALGFKQMALFYALIVAAHLAGSCIQPKLNVLQLAGIAIVTLLSFALLFLPIMAGTFYDTYRNVQLPSDVALPPLLNAIPVQLSEKAWYYPYLVQITQVVHRVLPFDRGLFEDKVANYWCALHTSGLWKLDRSKAGQAILQATALRFTVASQIIPCSVMFLKPKKDLIPVAFAAASWGFFLFSYQVHEKNVLLPLLPMTLLLATKDGIKPKIRTWVGYANLLGTWTLFPLLAKDDLKIPYMVLTALWAFLLGLPPFSIKAYTIPAEDGGLDILSKLIHLGTYAAALIWHAAAHFILPPTNKPDLWVVGNVALGASGFFVIYLWCLLQLLLDQDVRGMCGLANREPKPKPDTSTKLQ